ncbi:MAG: hypothetical protein M9894_16160 [Planctomycetes bacterium]|nr:hypothetical protein [Planctomycetota bacterium]
MSRLLAIAGLADLAGDQLDALDARARALVVRHLSVHARHFLEAGGVPSLEEWAALTPLERSAFVAAGRTLRVEQAVRTGQASRGELAALRVLGELDQGRAHDEALLEGAVREVSSALRAARASRD